MLVVLLAAVVLHFSIKLLLKNPRLSDFKTAFIIAIGPTFILVVSNILIGFFELERWFIFISLVLAGAVVFFLSNAIFSWGNKKSLALSVIYLATIIGSQLALAYYPV